MPNNSTDDMYYLICKIDLCESIFCHTITVSFYEATIRKT